MLAERNRRKRLAHCVGCRVRYKSWLAARDVFNQRHTALRSQTLHSFERESSSLATRQQVACSRAVDLHALWIYVICVLHIR